MNKRYYETEPEEVIFNLNTIKMCEITGKKRVLSLISSTIDGHWVDFDIYKNTCRELKKGLITLKEAKFVYDNPYYKVVNKFIRCLRKYAKDVDSDIDRLLHDIMNMLDDICVVGHKKVFVCMSAQDKTLLLLDMLEYYDNKGYIGYTNGWEQKRLVTKFKKFSDVPYKDN